MQYIKDERKCSLKEWEGRDGRGYDRATNMLIVHLGMGGANGRGDNSIIDEHLSSSTGKRSTYGYI